MNSLLDLLPVRLHGSSAVPTPDVQPLSTTVDGMVPLVIPWRRMASSLPMMYLFVEEGISCEFAVMLDTLARCWRPASRLAILHAHRRMILLAISLLTVGLISMLGLNVTVGFLVVLVSCSST